MEDIKIQEIEIGKLKENPDNPRVIKDDRFEELVESIKKFPQMLYLRPIVVNKQMIVLGGNQRLKACKEAGLEKVPYIKAEGLTKAQQKEFIVKDNVSFGEWDWEAIKSWDEKVIADWGLEVPEFYSVSEHERSAESKQEYSKKIKAPTYEPKNDKPSEAELIDLDKTTELLNEINKAKIDDDIKDFLRASAMRHTIFDYEKIADYYAHSNKKVQALMEKSALVIIDFDKAIENGFVQLSEAMISQYKEDYNEK